jgi:transglutaminase/protease-like cytokinesis protein 3
MCGSIGINCPVIIGIAKNDPNDDLKFPLKKSNHAWNAVLLYNKWYLVDATWSSGSFDEKRKKFHRLYNNYYYLTNPDLFIQNHFPDDKEWQLTTNKLPKFKYRNNPIFYPPFNKNNIQVIGRNSGVKKNTFKLKIADNQIIEKALLYFENAKDQNIVSLEIDAKNGYYLITAKLDDKLSGPFYLLLNDNTVLGYFKK